LTIQISNINKNFEKSTTVDCVNDETKCSINPDLSEAIQSMTIEDFPKDKAFFTNTLNTLDNIFIISKGPCQPDGPFPKKIVGNKYRSFSTAHYNEKSQGL
jgi:hypothetical protein